GKEGNGVVGAARGRDVPRHFARRGPLARREMAVPVHDALLGQVAKPTERIPPRQICPRQLSDRLERQLLKHVLRLQLAPQRRSEPALDERQQTRPPLLQELGEGSRVAAANAVRDRVVVWVTQGWAPEAA